jgi:methyl-accepting chemotaxis protein
MFGSHLRNDLQQCQQELAASQQVIAAIRRTFAMIEFSAQGEILDANEPFLAVMGYQLDELRGQHHRLFCSREQAASSAYAQFWRRLGAGESFSDRYMRVAKGGREVWLEASYLPVRNAQGQVIRVVKLAADITTRMQAEQRRSSSSIWPGKCRMPMTTFSAPWVIAWRKFAASTTASSAPMKMLRVIPIGGFGSG